MVDVVVVGGGLAGLSAAAAAGGVGREVVLLDGQGVGGRAVTDEVGRYRFNRGAHALYRKSPGRAVLRDLGVRVSGAQPPLRETRGSIGDEVGMLPVGAVSLARSRFFSRRDKVVLGKLLAGARRWRPQDLEHLTAAEWFDQLGLDGRPRLMVEMLTRLTTYAADMDIVGADVAAGQVQGAVIGGVDYLHQGWSTLVDGLTAAARERDVRIVTGARVVHVEPEGGRVRVELADGEMHARRVILAPGSPAAAAGILPNGGPPSWDSLGPAARLACIDLGMRDVPPMPILFGLDRPLYLSCHAPTSAGLAPRGAATVQLMRYLGVAEDPSPDEAKAEMEAHARLGGADPSRAEESRYLHRMVAVSAQSTPAGGGVRGRPPVDDTGHDGVLIAGDWVGPIGYLADASLVSGANAAKAALASLDHAPTTHTIQGTAA